MQARAHVGQIVATTSDGKQVGLDTRWGNAARGRLGVSPRSRRQSGMALPRPPVDPDRDTFYSGTPRGKGSPH
eukprot:scaffold8437_cov99-Isochrysis_galbana.AAC.1